VEKAKYSSKKGEVNRSMVKKGIPFYSILNKWLTGFTLSLRMEECVRMSKFEWNLDLYWLSVVSRPCYCIFSFIMFKIYEVIEETLQWIVFLYLVWPRVFFRRFLANTQKLRTFWKSRSFNRIELLYIKKLTFLSRLTINPGTGKRPTNEIVGF